jgi:hypothetical protein
MPRNAEDVETFLHRLNCQFETSENTFIVSSGGDRPPIAVHVAEPIVVVRADIGKVPDDSTRQLNLFRQLLTYNASDLVHAAYAIEGDEVVLSAGLKLENLDMNELAAVLSDIDLALSRHVKNLRQIAIEGAS